MGATAKIIMNSSNKSSLAQFRKTPSIYAIAAYVFVGAVILFLAVYYSVLVSKQHDEASSLKVLVIRECFGDAEPTHHQERDMIDDTGLSRFATVVSSPCLLKFSGSGLDQELFLCEKLSQCIDVCPVGTASRRGHSFNKRTKAGTGCGWCIPILKRIFESAQQDEQVVMELTAEEYARQRQTYIQNKEPKNTF